MLMVMPHRGSSQPQRAAPGPLRLRRLTLGLTQAEVAGLAGLSREQVVRLEAGACEPTWRTVRCLAVALKAEPTEIFPARRDFPATIGARRRGGRTA
jgi:transcriptional regulator with XRE-family HTH domain